MTGKRYKYAIIQLEIQGVLHPDAHMFVQEYFYQAEPEVVISILTQFSLKAGFKSLGYNDNSVAKSDIKQMHLRNTFIPMHRCDMTNEERHIVLESHMFLKQKRDGKIKVLTVSGGNK